MYSMVFRALGVLELLAAGVLVYFIWQIPGEGTIRDQVGRIETLARKTSDQAGRFQAKLDFVKAKQPQMKSLAKRVQEQTRSFSTHANKQRVDFSTLETVSKALGEFSEGLEGFAEVLDDEGIGQMGEGLKQTAEYLDKKLAPTADDAAMRLEKSVALLREDALRLKELVSVAPIDMKTVQEVHDALGKFSDGLQQMKKTVELPNLTTMREGFNGLETALTTGADQVGKLAGYNYPVVTFDGFKPRIDQKPFWPEGGTIADGMRTASKGVQAAGKELETLAKDLPKLRASLDDSRAILEKTRAGMSIALKNKEAVAPLLKNLPENTARLAEELPRLGDDLARVLRDTANLRQTAAHLREAEASMNKTLSRWPALRKNLAQSATLLKTTQKQLDETLKNREKYEASVNQTVALADTFAEALPLFTAYLEMDMDEQVASLGELRESIDEVAEAMPPVADNASRMMGATRWLLGVVAMIFLLHGSWLSLVGEGKRSAA